MDIQVSTHSRPKAAEQIGHQKPVFVMFQHTAARRRLVIYLQAHQGKKVSTHSRPKAAVYKQFGMKWSYLCFNTQPPEGG